MQALFWHHYHFKGIVLASVFGKNSCCDTQPHTSAVSNQNQAALWASIENCRLDIVRKTKIAICSLYHVIRASLSTTMKRAFNDCAFDEISHNGTNFLQPREKSL